MAAPIFQRTVVDTQGNVVEGAVVEVRNEATDELAPIFVDRELTDVKANPFTTDSTGFIRFFSAAGDYRIKATFGAEEIIFRFVQLIDTDELIDFDSAQTLQNKTLISPALGTPASGVVTNLTGTATININGTVGATTASTGAFTTLNTSSAVVFNDAGANVDFRVESDTHENALFVEGSSGNVKFGTVGTNVARIQPTAGNALLPTYSFDASADVGMYCPSVNNLGLVTGQVERMRINGAGNVGIGTSSPLSPLDVRGAIGIRVNEDGVGTKVISLRSDFAGVGPAINVTTNHPLAFRTNNTERMRLTNAGNLQFNSGFGSVATSFGCRAWVNFNGTGTVAIRASGNVSSITDNGTGNYTVNFTTAMPDEGFATVATAETIGNINSVRIQGESTSAVRVICNVPITTAGIDSTIMNVAIFR